MTGGRVEGLRILYLVGPLDAPRAERNFRQLFSLPRPSVPATASVATVRSTRPQVISGLLVSFFRRRSHCPTFRNISPPFNPIPINIIYVSSNKRPDSKQYDTRSRLKMQPTLPTLA